jgi:predicted amidohydrolase
MPADAPSIAPYKAVALQVRCDAVNTAPRRSESQPRIDAAIARIATFIDGAIRWLGPDAKLFVLPEYCLTGFPMGEDTATWIDKACVRMPGPELDRFSEVAAARGIWISGNSYEVDETWPGRYFQTSWLVGPSGLALKYRRLNSVFSPSPHDFWTEYRTRNAMTDVFPVADTPLGRLAAIASEEILFPEVARCLMVHGAELFLHSTSDIAGHARMPKQVCKLARAVENVAYVISANSAGITGIPIPEASTDGRSMVVDYRGLVLAEAGQGESMAAFAEVDIAALRRARRQPGMANLVARQRFDLYAPIYGGTTIVPPDQFPAPMIERGALLAAQARVVESLAARGVI